MEKRKYLNRFAVFFFAFMLFFTLFSGQLRKQTTPKVMAMRAREKTFPVTIYLEDGTEYIAEKRELALPAYALDFGGADGGEMAVVFVLEETQEGAFVRERQVKLGAQADGWFEVQSGVGKKDKVVYAADREIVDGMAVNVGELEK